MKRIPLGKYAKMKKMSRAQVIQMITRGQLQAEEVIENGNKVRYIIEESDVVVPSDTQKRLLPSPLEALVSRVADISQMQKCFEGSNAFYLVFEETLLIVDKQSGIITTVNICKGMQ
ncbi:hypothetical protein [Nitratiruptor tergarcus]|uniref:Uncharacterized protein n=1 Tax=Nitratiruptor tergarcus DSM 16512 TaxID=1069081 RepID=A0A1W1WT54_9BACT|nr:hypothetical protein [Nitratiruptor tergarcus]SMC09382.1 hypothetical protein SAMN05660197_1189 [Nitratiruptor tergarcus DSM 16512]